MRDYSGGVVTMVLMVGFIITAGRTVAAQQPTEPRTPMAPGSWFFESKIKSFFDENNRRAMIPKDRGDQFPGPWTRGSPSKPPDLITLETEAISFLTAGKADVVVSSRAETVLTLQLYRPDQSQWQEYQLAPFKNTEIACPSCAGKLKFSFNDGIEQSEIDVEAPSLLRIYPTANGDRWGWDSFKLQAASKSK